MQQADSPGDRAILHTAPELESGLEAVSDFSTGTRIARGEQGTHVASGIDSGDQPARAVSGLPLHPDRSCPGRAQGRPNFWWTRSCRPAMPPTRCLTALTGRAAGWAARRMGARRRSRPAPGAPHPESSLGQRPDQSVAPVGANSGSAPRCPTTTPHTAHRARGSARVWWSLCCRRKFALSKSQSEGKCLLRGRDEYFNQKSHFECEDV